MHENIRSLENFFDDLHSFASELSRAADASVLSETGLSANTCHDVQGYTRFHTYRADRTGSGVSVLIRNCYTSTYTANFSVCHAYFEINVVKVLLSNYCTVLLLVLTDHQPNQNSRVYNKI